METKDSAEAAVRPLPPRQAAAQTRVAVALACIEEAQRLIELAAQALCAVNGMAREWGRVGLLYEKTKNTWHAVSDKADVLCRRGGPVLDHEPTETEAKWERHRGELF